MSFRIKERAVRILLIDDDEDDFLMFKGLISEIQGPKWTVEWASSYDAGKSAIERDSHDICFLDYRLGVRTGLDLLKEVIAGGCRMPVILLTGYNEKEVDEAAMQAGAADYLIKDQVDPSSTLERSIRYSLHRTQTLKSLREQEAQVLVQDRLASVGLLASSLAHEIGTPLGVIRGRAEYMALQLKGNLEIKKNADIIISQIDRVSALIRSLLNLARGDEVKKSGEVLLNQVVSEVIDLIGHELRKHEIEIRNEVLDEVPVKVTAEAASLHQVILNLLVNSIHAIDEAVKHVKEANGKKVAHFIRLVVTEVGDQWVLHVHDSGCGISEKNMRNLFKPFFTTKDIGVGTGLGLVTSYRIIESWGGSIQVESREGVGTTFRVLLPKSTSAETKK